MIAAALERGIDLIGELELAWCAIPNRFALATEAGVAPYLCEDFERRGERFRQIVEGLA